METILCAAIWYQEQPTARYLPTNVDRGVVIAGHRHPHCIATFVALTGKRSVIPECGEYTQGFLTSLNRFVGRVEAIQVVKAANQQTSANLSIIQQLFSEDLY